ncbi:hypothetical protein OROMI_009641 [Orobanche minor]
MLLPLPVTTLTLACSLLSLFCILSRIAPFYDTFPQTFPEIQQPTDQKYPLLTVGNGGVSLREEDVVVSNVRIGLTCARHILLESIKFSQVGMLLPAFEIFQLRTCGIKAQVHATLEKKKRNI